MGVYGIKKVVRMIVIIREYIDLFFDFEGDSQLLLFYLSGWKRKCMVIWLYYVNMVILIEDKQFVIFVKCVIEDEEMMK